MAAPAASAPFVQQKQQQQQKLMLVSVRAVLAHDSLQPGGAASSSSSLSSLLPLSLWPHVTGSAQALGSLDWNHAVPMEREGSSPYTWELSVILPAASPICYDSGKEEEWERLELQVVLKPKGFHSLIIAPASEDNSAGSPTAAAGGAASSTGSRSDGPGNGGGVRHSIVLGDPDSSLSCGLHFNIPSDFSTADAAAHSDHAAKSQESTQKLLEQQLQQQEQPPQLLPPPHHHDHRHGQWQQQQQQQEQQQQQGSEGDQSVMTCVRLCLSASQVEMSPLALGACWRVQQQQLAMLAGSPVLSMGAVSSIQHHPRSSIPDVCLDSAFSDEGEPVNMRQQQEADFMAELQQYEVPVPGDTAGRGGSSSSAVSGGARGGSAGSSYVADGTEEPRSLSSSRMNSAGSPTWKTSAAAASAAAAATAAAAIAAAGPGGVAEGGLFRMRSAEVVGGSKSTPASPSLPPSLSESKMHHTLSIKDLVVLGESATKFSFDQPTAAPADAASAPTPTKSSAVPVEPDADEVASSVDEDEEVTVLVSSDDLEGKGGQAAGDAVDAKLQKLLEDSTGAPSRHAAAPAAAAAATTAGAAPAGIAATAGDAPGVGPSPALPPIATRSGGKGGGGRPAGASKAGADAGAGTGGSWLFPSGLPASVSGCSSSGSPSRLSEADASDQDHMAKRQASQYQNQYQRQHSGGSFGSLDAGADEMPAAEGAVAAAAVAERMLGPKERRRLAIVMVGLPARGKTFTAAKLTRYLRWLGHDTKHFNVGKYRRLKLGPSQTSDFFRGDNREGVDARNEVAAEAFLDMLAWMDEGGQVGVFDATNSTIARRNMLRQLAEGRCKVIFLECLCDDQAMIDRNAREKIQSSPDYTSSRGDPEVALQDFLSRLRNYQKVYEPVTEGSYIKLVNMATGSSGQMQVNNISGYLPGRIVFFLLNTHITPRPVLLTRHGESMYNVKGRIGGDAVLSPAGEEYSYRLADFINKRLKTERMASVWTSTLQRTILTSRNITTFPKVQWRALDEINAGICDGMTYLEIKEQMPEEYNARKSDKLRYRYPRGESYLDVIQRLEPVIIELERQRHPVVVIAHQAVLRALYAYFKDKPLKEVPHIAMPLHTVIELTTGVGGINERRYKLMDAPSSP